MFLIGDIIFYPVFGAGRVINIEEKEICDEIKKYYIINLIMDNINIMIPIDSDESRRLRKAVSIEECKEVFQVLKSQPQELPHKWSERSKYYNQSIRRGDIFLLASILRDIAGLSRGKKLSKSEKKIFGTILQMVCGELSLVLRKGYEETIDMVKRILGADENVC